MRRIYSSIAILLLSAVVLLAGASALAQVVTTTINIGYGGPVGVAVNPVTNQIYVANTGSASVTVIDGTTNVVTATVNVGANPGNLAP